MFRATCLQQFYFSIQSPAYVPTTGTGLYCWWYLRGPATNLRVACFAYALGADQLHSAFVLPFAQIVRLPRQVPSTSWERFLLTTQILVLIKGKQHYGHLQRVGD